MVDRSQVPANAIAEDRLQAHLISLNELEQPLTMALRELSATLAKAVQEYGSEHPEVRLMRAELDRGQREAQEI